MTCIVALKHAGKIYMGSDSAGVGGLSLTVRADPKIYRVGPALFGFTTSFRMGQLLGHSFTMPKHDSDQTIETFMATTFINALRVCLKDGGFAKKINETESGGNFLVGYRGRIFNVWDDYQVGESALPYDAVGCGFDLALGSLHTTAALKLRSILPRERIRFALAAAERFSAGVRGPFKIEMLEAK
jgi:hypothetical protein